ncbi:hypothetical protein JCM8097_009396 [Rhodosporidiobolus ruineniae]
MSAAIPKPVRVAIVGVGMSTTVFHAPWILSMPDKFSLDVIVERSATADKSKARELYPGVKVVNSLDEALKEDIDAIWILSINDTHYSFAKQTLLAGKHAIVEKPVTATSAEAYELAALAKEKNLVLAVYQNRRWDADFLTVKKLIQEGKFGELSEFASHFDRYKNVPNAKAWKDAALPGAGAAYDLGSHLIDQIVDLFGPPQRVTGLVRNSRLIGSPEVPDSFLIHLHYDPLPSQPGRSLPLLATARGSILSLITPQERYLIKGTTASYVKHGVDVQEDQLKAGGKDAIAQANYGVEPEELSGKLYKLEDPAKPETIISVPGSYGSWFANIADALLAADPSRLIVKPEQAALTIKLIELAEQSSREGRTLDLEL